MKARNAIIGILAILSLLSFATFANAAEVSIEKVELNDVALSATSTNKLDITRDAQFDVRVNVKSLVDQDNVEILGMITGYEYNDIASDRISANTQVMRMEANTTYVRTLKMSLPQDVDVDSYKLRLIISDRNGAAVTQDYSLKISADRHSLVLKDVIFITGTRVEAGKAVLAKVRLENQGQMTESDIKVSLTVPQLGAQASDYVDQIKAEKQDETEELYLAIPASAQAGEYTYVVDVKYNNAKSSITKTGTIMVDAKPAVAATVAQNTQTTTTATANTTTAQPAAGNTKEVLRKVLEGALLILVVLLVIIGLIIGFSKLSNND